MYKKCIVPVLFIFLFLVSHSQNTNEISGFVTNAKTKMPVAFATVIWKGSNIGVITNENGSFSIPILNNSNDNHLLITCIGYKNLDLDISDIPNEMPVRLIMDEMLYPINEVKVEGKKIKQTNAHTLVKKAINKIQDNYPQNKFMLEGYYRDYLKFDGDYLNLFESVLQIEDYGWNSSLFDQSRIRKLYGEYNPDFQNNVVYSIGYNDSRSKKIPNCKVGYKGANELVMLMLSDPIRNYKLKNCDFINYLDSDFLNNHSFNIENITYVNDKPVYILSIEYTGDWNLKDDRVRLKNGWEMMDEMPIPVYATGKICINYEDYSIMKFDYKVEIEDEEYKRYTAYEFNIEYRKRYDKTYLNYISFNNAVEIPNYNDSAYFVLKEIQVDKTLQRLVLKFNNEPDRVCSNNPDNYRIEYNKRGVEILEMVTDSNCVRMSLKNPDDFFPDFSNDKKHLLDIRCVKLKDKFGNVLNRLQKQFGYQFREFFTQKVYLDFNPIMHDECVDKMSNLFYNAPAGNIIKKPIFNSPMLVK